MSDRMLALSLWRPWPWTFFHVGKRVENRSWPLPSWAKNVPIAMHAAQRFDDEAVKKMIRWQFGHDATNVPLASVDHPCGVVGVFEFSHCYRIGGDGQALFVDAPLEPDRWAFGPYVWVVSRVVQLPEPIPCKGRQRLWRLPAEVEIEVRRQCADHPDRCKCAAAVHGPAARVAFDPDVYDCARCGHSNGLHDGAGGRCCVLLTEGGRGYPGRAG